MLADLTAGALEDARSREAVRPLADVERAARDRPAALPALEALAPTENVRIIAEVKRASPSRGDLAEIIVEAFIEFDYEITLLTLTQASGETLFCAPIGHRQERGDYQESWQPAVMKPGLLKEAQDMAATVTADLGGNGIWGVEFFIQNPRDSRPGTVYFSELSPRPHDTGMVTLAGTQNFSEFELHARAVLGLPVPAIVQQRPGASAVVLAPESLAPHAGAAPVITGMAEAAAAPNSDLRIFGKPTVRPYRRMAVAVTHGAPGDDVVELVDRAKAIAALIDVQAQS